MPKNNVKIEKGKLTLKKSNKPTKKAMPVIKISHANIGIAPESLPRDPL